RELLKGTHASRYSSENGGLFRTTTDRHPLSGRSQNASGASNSPARSPFRRYDLMVKVVVAMALVLGATASAQVARVDGAIGESATVAAGNAIGWFCDNPWVVDANMVGHATSNDWVVTGESVGTTLCRIGTELGRASFVVEVHVTPKPPIITR